MAQYHKKNMHLVMHGHFIAYAVANRVHSMIPTTPQARTFTLHAWQALKALDSLDPLRPCFAPFFKTVPEAGCLPVTSTRQPVRNSGVATSIEIFVSLRDCQSPGRLQDVS